jgi:hypothetical protein
VRYRPLWSKDESVADYFGLIGWRSDFDPVTCRGSCEKPKKRRSRAQSPRRKTSSRRNSSPAKLLYEIAMRCDFPSADSLMLSPLATDPAGLREHQSQGQTCVSATVAIAAAHWILEQ